ncbi:MAG: acyl-CoA synthetase FdrA [Acidobacteria bacterium]|nr:acyl-CoA synthetase FdrA [Acidobacteriota bacterium]
MSTIAHEIRRGAYADSIVLMQLQSSLAQLEGVDDAGVVMATEVNLELLAASRLLPEALSGVGPDDLLIVVRAESDDAAAAALAEIDRLMSRDAGSLGFSGSGTAAFRPKSLRTALDGSPQARWVLVSVPGRYAAQVAREAIRADRHVFLYSDNVTIDQEVELKREARERGLLVMGPDCGTATIGGVGLGFANRVQPGAIGIVAASGTGLQSVASRIDALGAGISQAIGTGGRDLSQAVAGATTLQALDLLAYDPATRVIVLISKPPAPEVAAGVLAAARATRKPVVVSLSGTAPPLEKLSNLWFAQSLEGAADRAVELLGLQPTASHVSPAQPGDAPKDSPKASPRASNTGFVRGLFSGGTVALEVTQALRFLVAPLASNLGVDGVADASIEASIGHTILDLGADEFTVGRPHPMIDSDLRQRRISQEASDPSTRVILLDLVLGDGAHPNPAGELAQVIRAAVEGPGAGSGARSDAGSCERSGVEVAVVVIGTDKDPQNLDGQVEQLQQAGAAVFRTIGGLVEFVADRFVGAVSPLPSRLELEDFDSISCINVGLEHFHDSLAAQEVGVVHVEWRPPAGGNERLQAILAKMG